MLKLIISLNDVATVELAPDNAVRRTPRRIAGDSGHDGANQEWSEVGNSLAHLPVPLTATEPA